MIQMGSDAVDLNLWTDIYNQGSNWELVGKFKKFLLTAIFRSAVTDLYTEYQAIERVNLKIVQQNSTDIENYCTEFRYRDLVFSVTLHKMANFATAMQPLSKELQGCKSIHESLHKRMDAFIALHTLTRERIYLIAEMLECAFNTADTDKDMQLLLPNALHPALQAFREHSYDNTFGYITQTLTSGEITSFKHYQAEALEAVRIVFLDKLTQ